MSEYESTWQRHREKACDRFCWYCENPLVGSTGWRMVPRSIPSRPKFGKKVRKAMKRIKVAQLKKAQQVAS